VTKVETIRMLIKLSGKLNVIQKTINPGNFNYFEFKFITMNKLAFSVICISILFFAACTSKEITAPPSKTDHITKSPWKFDKAMSGGADVSGFLQACYKDNIMTFLANGTGSIDEGPTKCNAGDPQTVNFTWNFTNNESTLNVTGAVFAGQSGSFTIITLNETQLVLQGTISTPSGNVTGQIFFKH
jgi:hypothetical protein